MPTGIQLQPPPRRQRDDYDRREQLAQAMMMQATDASPKGHWLAAVAQALQGYMGGRMARQAGNDRQDAATQQVKAQNSERDALVGALTGQFRDPNAPAAHEVPIPGAFGTSPMQELPQMDNRPQMPGFAQALLNSGSPGAQNLAIQHLGQVLMGQGQGEQYTLSPGAGRYDSQGRLIAERPATPRASDGYTLGPGQVRYGPNGEVIARGPERPSNERLTTDQRNYAAAVEGGFEGSFMDYMNRNQRTPAPPNSYQEYLLAVDGGYEGTYPQFLDRNRPAPPDRTPNSVREYEAAVEGGYTGTYAQWMSREEPGADTGGPVREYESVLPPNIDLADAVGGGGFLRGAINTGADWFGVGAPAEDTAVAREALRNLGITTQTIMQDAFPGRPSNYLMQRIEEMTVNPGTLGADTGIIRLRQTRDFVNRGVEELEAIVNSTSGYTNADRSRARRSLSAMRGLLSDYDRAIEGWGSGSTAGPRRERPPLEAFFGDGN